MGLLLKQYVESSSELIESSAIFIALPRIAFVWGHQSYRALSKKWFGTGLNLDYCPLYKLSIRILRSHRRWQDEYVTCSDTTMYCATIHNTSLL